MNIRTRLSVTFFAIVTLMLTASSIAVYYFAENTRQVDFYSRLKNRAINTVRVLTEIKEVDAELQQRLELNNPTNLPDQYIVIEDSAGNEIYRSTGPNRLNVRHEVEQRIRLYGEIHFSEDNRDELGFIYHTKKGDYIVVATASDFYGQESITHLRNILIATLLVSIIVVLSVSWIYSGRILKPISKIIEDISIITARNLNQRLDEGNQNDEVAQLARTFNDMLLRLQKSFDSEKSFIANASHEIKTPITIMSGEIEVTLLQERDPEHYIRTLKSVLDGLRRMSTLSTQLLLLAESSNQNPEKKFTSFRVDDILWEIKEWLERAFPGYHVEFHFDIDVDGDAFLMRGDEPLIRAAILNLTDNGCKYSIDNHVSVVVDTKMKDWITLTFINAGTIPPEKIDKVFSPFFRGSGTKGERGFGIGLSLVSNVVKRHNGELSVVSQEDVTQFTLRLPTATKSAV